MKNLNLLILLVFAYNYVNAQCGSSNYTEPQFEISVQNPACPLPGEIKVTSASGGIGPYTYTLLPNSISNSSGTFTNVPAGTYLVRLTDACGTIRTRQATVTPYTIGSTSTKTSLGCNGYEFNIQCTVAGPSLVYGYSINGGPIIWGDSSKIRLMMPLGAITLYVKDACGTQASSVQHIAQQDGGYIKVLNERIMCNGQEIYPEYYGFNSPTACLYRYPQRTLVECKQAPAGNYSGGAATNFFNLPFGQDYYVIVQDGCYRDSAFFKDKTSAGGSELNPFNWTCTTFDIHADGNNYDTVCLWNKTTNQLVSCKPWTDTSINPNTGKPWPYDGAEWYNLPYGSYYAFIFDPCLDTLVRIDTTVSFRKNFGTQLNWACQVNFSAVTSTFGSESTKPHKTSIYYPDGSLAGSYTDAGTYLMYPTWPAAGTITVIQEDGCGNKDTSKLLQPDLLPRSTIKFNGGCPGVNGSSGGGDLILSGSSVAYGGRGNGGPVASVTIVKKDGAPVNIPQTYTEWNSTSQKQDYYFTNLTTGVYVIESTIGCAGYKIYDTTHVKPYTYPIQNAAHILQCGSNPYAFRDSIIGGVAPYTYEIISTNPELSSLKTGIQSSNTFSIPPGTNLNTITIQAIDACGNSNTKEFAVNRSATCDPLEVNNPLLQAQLQNKPIKVFPNPSGKEFTIAFAQKKKTDYQVEIYNVLGVLVRKEYYKNIDTKNILIADKLNKGTYIINILDLKNNESYRFKQIVL